MSPPALPLPGAGSLSDGVVSLRPWAEADVPAVTEACRDPDVQRWTQVPTDYREDHAWAYIAGADGRRRRGESLDLAVAEHGSATLVGAMGLPRVTLEHGRADVGYWTAPWARRRGVATRALRLLSAFALGEVGLARLDLVVAVGNIASARVAERAGYAREGVLRSYLQGKEGREDAVMFSLLRADAREAAVSAT